MRNRRPLVPAVLPGFLLLAFIGSPFARGQSAQTPAPSPETTTPLAEQMPQRPLPSFEVASIKKTRARPEPLLHVLWKSAR